MTAGRALPAGPAAGFGVAGAPVLGVAGGAPSISSCAALTMSSSVTCDFTR